ncbi:MAG: VWA domain-containing protein [Candidatus Gracilibacteria bacterium]
MMKEGRLLQVSGYIFIINAMKKLSESIAAGTMLIFLFAACTSPVEPPETTEKVDDWQYDASRDVEEDRAFMTTGSMAPMAMESVSAPAPGGNIGFSVGGAKDIGNFRENIENGYLPIPSDITYEGLFYEYFFDTGQQEECTKLFCPSFSTAVSSDPFTNDEEYYLSVGLNSGIKEADFERKKLNLVIVLDISGSMGSPFSQYYYDSFGNEIELDEEESSDATKMEIASKSVVALMDHLEDDDHFGMVLFDDSSYVAKPLSRVGNTDMQAIKDHVLEIHDRGGTNVEAGMEEGTSLFDELEEMDPNEYENRIIFITDAQPNLGDTSRDGLESMTKDNAENGIYTTFVGVGVDFNTELVELMTKVRGANYHSVHSEKQFKETMDDNFDFMVTPLVFDLKLGLEADGYEIEKVFGSPEADEATGEIMYVNTLFPSKSEGGEVRGGLVLLKLKRPKRMEPSRSKPAISIAAAKKDPDEKEITFKKSQKTIIDNTGIRKGIVLTRLVNLYKSWAIDGHRADRDNPIRPLPVDCGPIILMESGSDEARHGIIIPEPPFLPPCVVPTLGEWERQSVELDVSDHYARIFDEFTEYLSDEMEILADEDLNQELELLEELSNQ